MLLLLGGTAFAEVVGKFTRVEGAVDIMPGGQLPAVVAKDGSTLQKGDFVRTKSNAKAEITFNDGSVIKVAQRSRIDVSEYSGSTRKLGLQRGKVQAIVVPAAGGTAQHTFEVRTPNAIAGVRGTAFYVYHQGNVTGVAVTQGVVHTASIAMPRQGVTLTAGMATTVTKGHAPTPARPISQSEMNSHKNEVTPSGSGGGGNSGAAPAKDSSSGSAPAAASGSTSNAAAGSTSSAASGAASTTTTEATTPATTGSSTTTTSSTVTDNAPASTSATSAAAPTSAAPAPTASAGPAPTGGVTIAFNDPVPAPVFSAAALDAPMQQAGNKAPTITTLVQQGTNTQSTPTAKTDVQTPPITTTVAQAQEVTTLAVTSTTSVITAPVITTSTPPPTTDPGTTTTPPPATDPGTTTTTPPPTTDPGTTTTPPPVVKPLFSSALSAGLMSRSSTIDSTSGLLTIVNDSGTTGIAPVLSGTTSLWAGGSIPATLTGAYPTGTMQQPNHYWFGKTHSNSTANHTTADGGAYYGYFGGMSLDGTGVTDTRLTGIYIDPTGKSGIIQGQLPGTITAGTLNASGNLVLTDMNKTSGIDPATLTAGWWDSKTSGSIVEQLNVPVLIQSTTSTTGIPTTTPVATATATSTTTTSTDPLTGAVTTTIIDPTAGTTTTVVSSTNTTTSIATTNVTTTNTATGATISTAVTSFDQTTGASTTTGTKAGSSFTSVSTTDPATHITTTNVTTTDTATGVASTVVTTFNPNTGTTTTTGSNGGSTFTSVTTTDPTTGATSTTVTTTDASGVTSTVTTAGGPTPTTTPTQTVNNNNNPSEGFLFDTNFNFTGRMKNRGDVISLSYLKSDPSFGIWKDESFGSFDSIGSKFVLVNHADLPLANDPALGTAHDIRTITIGNWQPNGGLTGVADGVWGDLEKGNIKIMTGKLTGSSNSGTSTFGALANGFFIELNRFMDDIGNPTFTKSLGFPIVKGADSFALSGKNTAGGTVSLGTVNFYSHNVGDPISLWVARNVSGTYSGSLAGQNYSLLQTGATEASSTILGNLRINNVSPATGPNHFIGEVDAMGEIGSSFRSQFDGVVVGTYDPTTSTFSGSAAGLSHPVTYFSTIKGADLPGGARLTGFSNDATGPVVKTFGTIDGILGGMSLWGSTPQFISDFSGIGFVTPLVAVTAIPGDMVMYAPIVSKDVPSGKLMTADGGAYNGHVVAGVSLTGSTFSGPSSKGIMNALSIDPSGNAGILQGGFTGWVDTSTQALKFDGWAYPVTLATAPAGLTAATLNDPGSITTITTPFAAAGTTFVGTPAIRTPLQDNFTRSYFTQLPDFGIGQFGLYAPFANAPTANAWRAHFDSNSSGVRLAGSMIGDTWDPASGTLHAVFQGGYHDMQIAQAAAIPTTGIFIGETVGTFNPTTFTMQAMTSGAWMTTVKFLAMVDSTAGPAALAKLNIPAFEVGRASFSGGNSDISVNVNDVRFFAPVSGARPQIFATQNITGTYSATPINPIAGATLALTQGASPTVTGLTPNFTINQWDTTQGKWAATLSNAGSTGTIGAHTNIGFTGPAAGRINATNTFSGTAAGAVK
jgi:hypothetical protein